MKTQQLIPILLIIVVLALVMVKPARGQGGISVTDADAMMQVSTNRPTEIETAAGSVPDRYVLYYADKIRFFTLNALPAPWRAVLEQTPAHFTIFYADKARYINLNVIPSTLQTLTGNVPDRILLFHADKMRNVELQSNYPAAVIHDTAPPQISTVGDNTVSGDTVVITWNTDEFADSTVVYGTQSGSYPLSVSDALLVKQHAITLTQLSAETTYFYQTQSTDRSGNTAHSSEYSLEVQTQKFIYLPLILK